MICRMGIVGRFGALSVCVRSGSALLLTDRALSSTGKAKHRRANTAPVFLCVCMFACPFICLSVCIFFVCVLVLIDGQEGHSLSSQGKQYTGRANTGPFLSSTTYISRVTRVFMGPDWWGEVTVHRIWWWSPREEYLTHNHSTYFGTNQRIPCHSHCHFYVAHKFVKTQIVDGQDTHKILSE